MRRKTLLVDADVLRYQIAFANESSVDWDGDDNPDYYTNPKKAVNDTEEFILDLKERFNTDKLIIVLSDNDWNFREELDETYKANRKDKRKPELWQLVSDYLEWGDHGHPVEQFPRLEGDDVLGILHTTAYADQSIIVTIDKDMFTVPGLIYRWTHQDEGVVSNSVKDAAMFHLTQVLMGDQVDNYKGCPGIGEVKANRIRESCRDPQDMWEAVVATYADAKLKAQEKGRPVPFEDPEAAAIHQARLAFILRDGWYSRATKKVKLWNPKHLPR